MRKALSQNPNMLRTIVGLGMTLILILSYAVYSATLDSGYYLATTTNDAREVVVSEDPENGSYTFSTEDAISWINISIDNALLPHNGSYSCRWNLVASQISEWKWMTMSIDVSSDTGL